MVIVNAAWESKDLNEDETAMNELKKLFEKATFGRRYRTWSSFCVVGSFSPWSHHLLPRFSEDQAYSCYDVHNDPMTNLIH